MALSTPVIAVLPDELVNRIAAGEVVERPASVVKELVENALDAGARSVRVEIEGGGKRLVRVRDDGQGMSREDAPLAVLRHATSKLKDFTDLDALGTHGFRGEALPAIAGVSHLVLRTREDDVSAGTEVEVRHGAPAVVRDVGHPRGTTVEVHDLFGSVPARRKFLRADATEAGHVSEAVTLLALARPDVSFALVSGGRDVIRAPAVADRAARVYQLFGSAFVDDTVAVDWSEGPQRVSGFVSRPDRAGGSRLDLRLFVNGRAVRDRAVARAVVEGARAAGLPEFRGAAIVFLETPLHLVDVNVHPAKAEVRFAEARSVWHLVEQGVRRALADAGRLASPALVRPELPIGAARVIEAAERGVANAAAQSPLWPSAVREGGAGASAVVAAGVESVAPTVLGQHRNTYIVVSDGEALGLVDQHTAHERVRYEELVAALAERRVPAQGLLVPAVMELPPRLRPLFEGCVDELHALGYDVAPFGGGAVRISAVPAVLAGRDPGPSLVALLDDLLERGDTGWQVAGTRHRLAATMACHSAVRAGQPLPLEVMRTIVAALEQAEHAALCPHGRPTRVRIPPEEVARWFGRTGWKRQ